MIKIRELKYQAANEKCYVVAAILKNAEESLERRIKRDLLYNAEKIINGLEKSNS